MMLPGLLLGAAAVACVVIGLLRARRSVTGPAASSPLPVVVRVLAGIPVPPGARRVLGGTPDAVAIVAAGLPRDVAIPQLARARAGGALVGLLVGALAAVAALPLLVLAPLAALGGRAVPDRVVAGLARRRRQRIVWALPDLLDLMVICVEAGMALDPALGLAAHRLGGALGDEVQATLADQALGTPRRAAYQGLAQRTGSEDVGRLVASLLQAEELGTPLATALAGQAEALRAARRQGARDRAARAAPRIQLVVALVMVPGAMLLILGVMIIELASQVGAVMGGT
ncbi:MAG: type II secretion system F family protein [Thermoleophilia bacterium]|nr:type II secretion system F family protein [Thermoleophilia bacterium]